MNLLRQTLKSLNKREKVFSFLFLLIFVWSGFNLFLVDSFGGFGSIGKYKDIYTEALVGEIIHLNPLYTEFNEVDSDISSLIFSGLVKYDAKSGEFIEDIATHVLSEDKLTYKFTVKNDIFWHDGTPLSAEDIYFTFAEVIQSPDFDNPVLKSNFEGVKIELLNTREVSFTLNSQNQFFFTALTVGILPKHILADVPVVQLSTHEFNQLPIGTGPYKAITAYEFGSKGEMNMSLVRNEDYYKEVPKIEFLRFIVYPSQEDLISGRSQWNGTGRIRNSQLSQVDTEDMVVYRYELPQYTALFFNTDSPNLNQKNERLGVSKAIDKKEIIDAIEYKAVIDTPLLELNQDEWIHKFALEEASGALFDAGWKLEEGAEYRTNEDGEIYEMNLLRRDFSSTNLLQEEIASKTAETIQSQLKKAGIKINIEIYSMEELSQKIKDREYDMLLYGQSLGYNLDIFSYWHSSQASENGLNLSNYQNAQADFQIEKVRTSFEDNEREEALEALASVIADDVPAVFLYTPSYFYLLDKKITGFSFEKLLLPRDRFSNIEFWQLN